MRFEESLTADTVKKDESTSSSYLARMLPLFTAVFLMRFAFSFTVVSLQYIVLRPSSLGIVSAAYPIMEMIAGFCIGVIMDKVGRKWIISIALIASSAISLAFTFSPDPVYLAIMHGLQGICAAAIIVGSLALLTDIAKRTSLGRDMGTYDFFTILGYGLGFFVALIIINNNPANAHLPFYIGALAALVGGIFSSVMLRDSSTPRAAAPSIKENFKIISSSKSAQTLLPTWFVLMTVVGVFLTFTNRIYSTALSEPIHFLGRGGLAGTLTRLSDAVGIAALVVALVLLGLSQTSLGALSDRVGRPMMALIGQVSLMGLLGSLIGLFMLHVNILYLIPFFALFGAGLLTFTPSALAELAEAAPKSGRGSTMGVYSVAVSAGTIFGPLAGGALISSYGTARGLSIIFAMGIVIVLVFMIPRVLQFSRDARKDIQQQTS